LIDPQHEDNDTDEDDESSDSEDSEEHNNIDSMADALADILQKDASRKLLR